MQLPFVKYQATGNDFILIDNFHHVRFEYDPFITQQLCHRQLGVGADGIITLAQEAGCDFAMLHYNADGSRGGGLCGNGARAAIHYATQLGIVDKQAHFRTIDGLHHGYLQDNFAHLKLQDVHGILKLSTGYYLYNGTRHHIEIVADVEEVDMQRLGFPRRYMAPFEKEGVNLNFVQLVQGGIRLRTCECGLETEPLSCGTGAVAAALVASDCYGFDSPLAVEMKGGTCWVTFTRLEEGQFCDIYLGGSVYQSFHGSLDSPIAVSTYRPNAVEEVVHKVSAHL